MPAYTKSVQQQPALIILPQTLTPLPKPLIHQPELEQANNHVLAANNA